MNKLFSLLLLLISWSLSTALHAQQAPVEADGDPLLYSPQNRPSPSLPFSSEGRTALTSIPGGDAIEGDYIAQTAFSRNGEEVWVAHRITDNISVFDWDTQEVIADIPVGDQPIAMALSDQYAVVACYNSNDIYIINVSDYSVEAVIPSASQPASVQISPDFTLAVVGCDENDVGEVINLTTLTKETTIDNFPVYLLKFSFITSSPRNSVYYSGCAIAPDNSYIANGASDDEGIFIYDPYSGDLLDTITEISSSPLLTFSGDQSKLIAIDYGNPGFAYQIDAASLEVLKEVEVGNGSSIWTTYSGHATNMDGSKVFIPAGNNQGAMVRFDTEDFSIVPVTGSASWVASSPDYQYAIHGHYYLSIIDFDSESVVSSLPGQSISWGAASGTFNRLVGADPLRYEGFHFYNYPNGQLEFLSSKVTGSELEADVSYTSAVAPSGEKAVIVHPLSQSVSVVNLNTGSLEAIIPIGPSESFDVAITPDEAYAVVPLRLYNTVVIIDLETFEIVAEVNCGGQKPGNVIIHPSGDYAYSINAGGTDNIGVIGLNGENSALLTTFQAGNFGVSWTNYGIRSEMKIHPNGELALAAASFDDQVNLISLTSNSVIQTIDLVGFPLQVAFNEDGSYALVSLKNTNKVALFSIQNDQMELISETDCGPNPTRIAWDKGNARFLICSNNDKTVEHFNPETSTIDFTETFASGYTPLSIAVNAFGNRATLLRADDPALPDQIIIDEETFELPALPIHFMNVSANGSKGVICHPGTDQISIIDFELPSLAPADLQLTHICTLSPQPAASSVFFETKPNIDIDGSGQIRIYDLQGKLVRAENVNQLAAFRLDRRVEPAGLYYYQLVADGRLLAAGKISWQD